MTSAPTSRRGCAGRQRNCVRAVQKSALANFTSSRMVASCDNLARYCGTNHNRKNMQNESQLMAASGRPIKFTPERFEQIRNLVERGMSREQIAETIGVTVGALQVTCSRHGISLRRPILKNGVAHAPPSPNDTPAQNGVAHAPPSPNDTPAQNGVAHAPRFRNDKPAQGRRAELALRLRYRGIDRIIELPLSEDVLGCLVIEAHFRNLSISDLTAKLIIAGLDPGSP